MHIYDGLCLNDKENIRRPGIEPRASEWKSEMLPLHQRRVGGGRGEEGRGVI